MSARRRVPTGVLADVVAHVTGAVCVNPSSRAHSSRAQSVRPTAEPSTAVARAPTAPSVDDFPPPDPDSSSIAGRRASGFLQVS